MKEANPILEMSYRFALDVTSAARIMRERKEYDLASQFWRSGTSIGANVEEAQAAQSRADFKSRMESRRKRHAKPSTGSAWLATLVFLAPRMRKTSWHKLQAFKQSSPPLSKPPPKIPNGRRE
jgi:hypothetical protein